MTVSKSAWHYRYMAWWGFSRPSRLCPYFWKLVFSLMVPLVVAVAVLVILGGLTWVVIHIGPPIWSWLVYNAQSILVGVGMAVGFVAVVVGLFTLVSWLFSTETYAMRQSIAHSGVVTRTGKGASITGSYLAAWHHKVCPFLEFTE